MSAPEHHDAIMIGSGQGGTPLAANFARAGYDTVLVEREHIGGTCINEGCTPTKTMIASGRVAYLARRGADFGVRSGDIQIDMPRVRERKREVVAIRRHNNESNLAKIARLKVIFGEARFTGPKSLDIVQKDGTRLQMTADRIFINAGCRPAVPAIDGLNSVPFLNSTSIMELDEVPEHLLVLGGGYVGLEFSQLFRRLGSRVTIVQAGPQLLGHEDADIASAVLDIFHEDGIEVLLDTKASAVTPSPNGIRMSTAPRDASQSHGSISMIEGSHLLTAAGRVPNTEALNLSAAGIVTDERGFIKVNEKLETNVPGTYALGDIKGGPAFTHISYDDFRIIRTNLLKNGNASTEGRMVPYCVFIDPELGRIGITEAEAQAQKKEIRVAKMPMTGVARAQEMDESRGFMKVIIDAKSGQILERSCPGSRRWRNHDPNPNRHDGQAALHHTSRCDVRPPDPRRIAQ